MMGEVVLHSHGVPHYAFPVPINAVEALNSEFDPREAHLLLWGIEQSLMPADTGKRFEFEIVREHGDPLIATFQDFDWADEVVHVKIGRRWIASEYGESTEAREAAAQVLEPLGRGRHPARSALGPGGVVADLRRTDAGRRSTRRRRPLTCRAGSRARSARSRARRGRGERDRRHLGAYGLQGRGAGDVARAGVEFARADGPLRRGRRDRQRGDLLGLRRVLVRDRLDLHGRGGLLSHA